MRGGATPAMRPLASAAAAYVCGTAAGLALPCRHIPAAAAVCLSCLLALVLLRARRRAALAGVFAFALVRCAVVAAPFRDAGAAFASLCESGGQVVVQGEVCAVRPAAPAACEEVLHRFRLKGADFRQKGGRRRLPGTVSVSLFGAKGGFSPRVGMRLEVAGRVFCGKGADPAEPAFDEVFVVTRAGAARVLYAGGEGNAFSRFRDRAAEILSTGLGGYPEERELLLAMTLGRRADLPQSLLSSFRRAGTIHVFAISGLHVGAIALMLAGALSFLGVSRRYVALPLAPLLAAYVYMTGMQPSAIRAGVMIVVYYAALVFGRRPDVLGALAFTVVAILLANPMQLTELSLVLSFSMVLGIVLFTGPVHAAFARLFGDPGAVRERQLAILAEGGGDGNIRVDRWPRDGWIAFRHGALGLFSAAFAAALVSFPLTAYFFGILTPYSILANVVVVPLAFPLMAIAGSGLFLAFLFPPLATVTNHLAVWLAWAIKSVSAAVASLPYAAIRVAFPLWALALWYLALLLLLRGLPGLCRPVLNVREEAPA